MLSTTHAKIILPVGVTALFTSVVLIAGFLGYLYLRAESEPKTIVGSPADSEKALPEKPKPRSLGANPVAAEDILKVTLFESTLANTTKNFFGNINIQNYSSTSKIVSFSADGSAAKRTVVESTVNGVKSSPKKENLTGNIDKEAFAALAKVLADNDFVNEPDSREISSLPIKKVLSISYKGGEKVINTGNMGKNTLETSAMLEAFRALEQRTAWANSER